MPSSTTTDDSGPYLILDVEGGADADGQAPLIWFNFEITVELAGQQLLRVGQQIAFLWS